MGKSQKGGSTGSQRAKKDKSRKQQVVNFATCKNFAGCDKICKLQNFRNLVDFCSALFSFVFLLFFPLDFDLQ